MRVAQPADRKAAPALPAASGSPATASRPAPAAARSIATAANHSADSDRSSERISNGKTSRIGPEMTILIGAAVPTETFDSVSIQWNTAAQSSTVVEPASMNLQFH